MSWRTVGNGFRQVGRGYLPATVQSGPTTIEGALTLDGDVTLAAARDIIMGAAGQILADNGSVGSPALEGAGNGIYFATNNIKFDVGGGNKADIDASGVGALTGPIYSEGGFRMIPEAVETANFSLALTDTVVLIDTQTTGAVRATLPGSAPSGTMYWLVDARAHWGTNNLTVRAASGDTINDGTAEAGAGESDAVFSSGTVLIAVYDPTAGNWAIG